MINKPTVFVLGAGASEPYGFPVSRGLVDEAVRMLRQPDEPRIRMLQDVCGCSTEVVARFADSLEHAATPSIDAFLEGRKDYLEIGKAVIAALLIPYEIEAALFSNAGPPERIARRWYDYVLNRMGTTADEFRRNLLSILTFNYDRSLEQFLLIALQNRFGITAKQVAQVMEDLPIVHLYGQLGALPDLDVSRALRPYAPDVTSETIGTAAAGINIIQEDLGHSPQFAAARTLLLGAEEIWFLGFGYHQTNIERLSTASFSANDRPKGLRLSGTAFGLAPGESTRTMMAINAGGSPALVLGGPAEDILTFLRSRWT